jgi:hypothetical protein
VTSNPSKTDSALKKQRHSELDLEITMIELFGYGLKQVRRRFRSAKARKIEDSKGTKDRRIIFWLQP